MKRPVAAILLSTALAFAGIALLGCDNVTPELYGTPTPSASPTPLPDAFSAEITAVPIPTDELGKPLDGDENHYFQYLSFGEMRIYEYGTGTFLDGICINAFPETLDGRIDIVFYTAEGKLCGEGTIHNALGTTALVSGSNAIYAEIQTDIDVREMNFVWEIKQPFLPVAETAAP